MTIDILLESPGRGSLYLLKPLLLYLSAAIALGGVAVAIMDLVSPEANVSKDFLALVIAALILVLFLGVW
ncbi:hypothetical protein [Natrinema sp. 1APR25-10V2]|uniref:hypothetical protein n=1 Tax=Natrinema sp. 1APR25-10V2 TaxID=2951081 RepID=UPI002876B38A|nr:hypothetical protein [Natrinema sp. 1APR25-10V2]MDS0477722.1 hypothetical protein [Natrinema sp. 1APR25-10V2]